MYYVNGIAFFSIIYCVLRLVLQNVKNPHEAAKYSVSMINTYLFLASANVPLFISYYLYDLVLMAIYREYIFIIHHIITLYFVTLPETHLYYNEMMLATYSMKLGELTLYWFKIISASGIKMPVIYQFSLESSIILWSVFRVILPIYIHNKKFGTNYAIDALAIIVYVTNIIWIYKMYRLSRKKLDK